MVAPTPSKLDQRQILQNVHDEATGTLRTTAAATIVNADIDVALDSTEDNVAIRSSTGVELAINPNGSIDIVEGVKQGGVYGLMSMPLAGTAYEVKVGVSALLNRRVVTVTATSTGIYWGLDSSVTVSTGTPLMNNQVLTITTDPDNLFKLYLVSAATNRTARIVEIP